MLGCTDSSVNGQRLTVAPNGLGLPERETDACMTLGHKRVFTSEPPSSNGQRFPLDRDADTGFNTRTISQI